MEKLKLGSGVELTLIVCGILTNADTMTIKFLPEDRSLDEIDALLLDPEQTKKMTLLSESGDELAIYNGFTELQSLSQEMAAEIGSEDGEAQTGKLVTAVLIKPDQQELRIAALEDTIDALILEDLGIDDEEDENV